jgi:type IV pilus assembly protein PilV
MKTNSRRSLRNAQSGVMLLEALIATDSRDRAEASNLASQLVGEMWLNRAALASYQYSGSGTAPAALTNWIAQVDAALPDVAANPPIVTVGASSLGASVGTETTVTLRWKNPTDTTIHQFVMTAYIN